MYAPVVLRFLTYGVEVSELSRAYMTSLLAGPQINDWMEKARQEEEIIESEEAGV